MAFNLEIDIALEEDVINKVLKKKNEIVFDKTAWLGGQVGADALLPVEKVPKHAQDLAKPIIAAKISTRVKIVINKTV